MKYIAALLFLMLSFSAEAAPCTLSVWLGDYSLLRAVESRDAKDCAEIVQGAVKKLKFKLFKDKEKVYGQYCHRKAADKVDFEYVVNYSGHDTGKKKYYVTKNDFCAK